MNEAYILCRILGLLRERGPATVRGVRSGLISLGFSAEEVSEAQVRRLLHTAMRYDLVDYKNRSNEHKTSHLWWFK